MCLAIFKPADAVLDREEMLTAWVGNGDGGGLAYYAGRYVNIEKGFFSFSDFWKAIERNMDKKMIVHFRWATHGTVGIENCHPFELEDGALIHNGIIAVTSADAESAWYSNKGKTTTYKYPSAWAMPGDSPSSALNYDPYSSALAEHMDASNDETCSITMVNDDNDFEPSDTKLFVDEYLADMGYKELVKSRRLVERLIGGGSKMVTLHDNGQHIIFNEKMGHWDNGVWYSNYGYVTERFVSLKKGGYNAE